MSHGQPNKANPVPSGGGGGRLIFMIVLMVGALLMFSRGRNSPNPGDKTDPAGENPQSNTQRGENDGSIFGKTKAPATQGGELKKTEQGGFVMEEGKGVQTDDENSPQKQTFEFGTTPKDKTTKKGEWSTGEVSPKDSGNLRLNNPADKEPAAKTTKKGEWSTGEVK